eukprot:TRINITY_DN6611_c0_g2_i1.p1 TRINITY_DN6611_c0_g2~~TRINITY_DN6611_c0_g2_i1.p1  ORF type:complete len:1153 (-),score=374.80 TRINITY_DN6611_c0_g2_i1:62-3520(-)
MGVQYRVYSYMDASAHEEAKKPRSHPGPITNEDIIDEEECYKSSDKDDIYNCALRTNARERFDFKVITKGQWDYLFGKYGGVPLRREVLKIDYSSYKKVESVFQRLNLIILPPRTSFEIDSITPEKPLHASYRWTYLEVKDRIIEILNQPAYGYSLKRDNFRLWKIDGYVNKELIMQDLSNNIQDLRHKHIESTDPDLEENSGVEFPGICLDLYKPDKPIEEFGIGSMDKIVIEQADERGVFIFRLRKNIAIGRCEFCTHDKPLVCSCRCKTVSYCSVSCLQKDARFHEERCTAFDDIDDLSILQLTPSSNRGLTGLRNLGNTCFMNSGLQCLSNTFLLSKYFLEDQYKDEINDDNPLGMQGILAKSYAKLVKMLWTTKDDLISPSFFKKAIGKFRAIFSSYSQQDSQELITAVLDGLHEDLNRVKKKPYVESKTTDDPKNDSISVDSWYCHLARNQSVIVDLMYGQYKSVLKCPKCTKYSVTFDPFSAVTLPIPSAKQRLIHFFYVPYNLALPIQKHSMVIPKGSTVEDMRVKMAERLGVPKDGSTFIMLSKMTFDRFLCRDQKASLINKMKYSQLYIQEINPKYIKGPENEGIEKRKEEYKEEESKESALCQSQSASYSASYPTSYSCSTSSSSKPHIKNHDDYNNGLSDDMLRVSINIQKKTKSTYSSYTYKERLTFNRVIYIKKSFTLRELHMEVFKYFRPMIEKSFNNAQRKKAYMGSYTGNSSESFNDDAKNFNVEEAKDNVTAEEQNENKVESAEEVVDYGKLSDEEFFGRLFPGIDNSVSDEENKFPYELRLLRITERYYGKKCCYCDQENCDNCLVPFDGILKVQDLLNFTDNPNPKNDYFYHEHRGYTGDRKEFEFEVIFKEDKGINFDYFEQIETSRTFTEELRNPVVNIYNCFDQFSKWEDLDEDNLWYCPTCKDFVQASKRIEIFKAPPILILHLKRFKIKNETSMCRSGERLDTFVDYPLEDLDLTNYVHDKSVPAIYNLYAVSNHYGSTSFGHYTAFALNGNEWRRFDDSTVSAVDSSQVCSAAGYVLFYKRKELTDDTDIKELRQSIPNGYKLNVIEIKSSSKSKNEEERKGDTIGNGTLGENHKGGQSDSKEVEMKEINAPNRQDINAQNNEFESKGEEMSGNSVNSNNTEYLKD